MLSHNSPDFALTQIALHDNDETDAVIRDSATGRALKQKLNFGRPNWDVEFQTLKDNHAGRDMGVFFCGPKAISTQLHQCSNKFTEGATRFFYHKVWRALDAIVSSFSSKQKLSARRKIFKAVVSYPL